MTSTKDVAAYILQTMDRPLTTYQVQKLSFYSQSWFLVAHSRPLIPEQFLAYEQGPVSYSLYDQLRRMRWVRTMPSGNAQLVTQEERDVIDSVIDFYGHLSGDELSERTHAEAPWKVTWERVKASIFASNVIQQDLIESFYRDQYVNTTDHPRLPINAKTYVNERYFTDLVSNLHEPDDNSAFLRTLAAARRINA